MPDDTDRRAQRVHGARYTRLIYAWDRSAPLNFASIQNRRCTFPFLFLLSRITRTHARASVDSRRHAIAPHAPLRAPHLPRARARNYVAPGDLHVNLIPLTPIRVGRVWSRGNTRACAFDRANDKFNAERNRPREASRTRQSFRSRKMEA